MALPVTSKKEGRITIPAELRAALHIEGETHWTAEIVDGPPCLCRVRMPGRTRPSTWARCGVRRRTYGPGGRSPSMGTISGASPICPTRRWTPSLHGSGEARQQGRDVTDLPSPMLTLEFLEASTRLAPADQRRVLLAPAQRDTDR